MRGKGILIAVAIAATAIVSGCSTTGGTAFVNAYGAKNDSGYALPKIPVSKIDRQFRRQVVSYETKQRPGTIIIDTSAKHLHLVLGDGKAMRYGIGVGREGFLWKGTAKVGWKREWPTWTPPEPMIRREPDLAKYRGGMKPGLNNPLGARALYLMRNGRDTGYRLHGTPEWWSIGGNVSSGCIRLMNQDIIDLYERVKPGAKVIVT
ncbi:L,D-transpeptidase [Oricola sp.]|uniref:L,D-transpeptidase n=1 Tax=Oricola sp. TaxID=1979950 RepID=UPI003BA8F360